MRQQFKEYSEISACVETRTKVSEDVLYVNIEKGENPNVVFSIESDGQEKGNYIIYGESLQDIVNWLRDQGMVK